jgi:hypothetical protein
VHDYLAQHLIAQQRASFAADAERHRLIRPARQATTDAVSVGPYTLGVRPIERTDTDGLLRLFGRLSTRSVRFRFFAPIHRLSSRELTRMADVDHHTRDALVALDGEDIVAVARYEGRQASGEAEVAMTVEDRWQHRGVGSTLLPRLSRLAVARDVDTFVASILPDNRAALALVRRIAPQADIQWSDGAYRVSVRLRPVV